MIKAVIFDLFETLITEWACPKYTTSLCARDLGIDVGLFREIWESMHGQTSTGGCTYEQVIETICQRAGIAPGPEKLEAVFARRHETKSACLAYRHEDVLQMLDALRARGIKLGLISNCFSEEAAAFRKSALVGCFDAAMLSWEVGLAKPDPAVFLRCARELCVSPSECLYVGDGGSRELYGAREVGMTPLRAMWFLNRYVASVEPMPFDEAAAPRDVLFYLAR